MIRDEIVEWVRLQPYWSQIIADSLLRGEKLDDESLNKIYIVFKQESKLLDQPLEKEKLEFLTISEGSENSVKMRWKSVSNISGVNALKNGESLSIGKQVTVVYGENGSGKSGYSRLLNNSFVSRGDKNILANIFEKQKLNPSANFQFEDANGNIVDKLFPDDRNSDLFNTVSVFDTVSAINDLTKETELAFVPMEFNFFEDFTEAFLAIKGKLENEIKENTKANEFGEYFEREALVKKTVQQINDQTDFSQIKLLSNTSGLEDDYKEKIDRKKELLSLNINGKLKEYKKFKQELVKIKEKSELLNKKYSNDRIIKTRELLTERITLKELSSKEGLSQLKGENIYNLGSSEWKEFIVAADKYNISIDQKVNDCIFCGQNIEKVTVIDKYWRYLKSTAEKNLNIAELNIEKIRKNFELQDITLIVKNSSIEDWLKENKLSLYNQLIEAEKEFMNINSRIVKSLTKKEWDGKIEAYTIDISIFEEVFEMLEKQIKQLDAEKVNKELINIENFLNDFNDKLHLEKILPKIEIYINTMRWVTEAKKINMTTQKITTFQNKLFSKYVSSKYIEKFDIECKKLNANFSAEIQQRGRKGATLSRLEIKGRKPIDILSEGEQRSIALANFLAETSLNDSNVCLVFDDPVSSLDHKRREVIAKRLVEEAIEKQIMIFTHDITFLMGLQDQCKTNEVDCYVTTIKKFQKEAGIVLKNNIPWEGMTVSKRIRYLRGELQTIKAFYESINSNNIEKLDDYKIKAKSWCGLLRETWERAVEEILFNNTVQRFNQAIQTQRLKKAKFTKELSEEIEEGMTTCSNWVHDRAGSLGEKVPNPEELEEYLKSCDEFIKKNNPNK